jgi:hypothetical protein
MVTASPGDALTECWGKKIGRLVAGALGDICVVEKIHDDPWENLVKAREEQILLVLVDGQPRYGIKDLVTAAGGKRTTAVTVGTKRRRVILIDPEDENKPIDEQRSWTYQEVLDRLKAVMRDPIGAVEAADAPNAAAGRIPSAMGPDDDPLILELDMPGGLGQAAGPPPEGVPVAFDGLPSLRHDRNWRASVKRGPFHNRILDDLDRFYQ